METLKKLTLEQVKKMQPCAKAFRQFINDFGTEAEIEELYEWLQERKDWLVWSMGAEINLSSSLLNLGAYVNTADLEGWTALHWAAINNNAEIIKLLLNKQANKNITDNKGRKPIYWAIRYDYEKCIDLLA